MVPVGVSSIVGGFGAVNTVLTFQETGQGIGLTESACVGVSSLGTLNATGTAECQGRNMGGNEKSPAGFPHNQTFLVSNASQIGLVFNADQPAGGSITINHLTLALFNSRGAVGFTSGPFSPITLSATQTGIGKSGFLFELGSTQAAAAQAAINGGFDYLGLSSTTTSAFCGPETFFLTTTTPSTSTPEPSSLLLLGLGLADAPFLCRKK